MRTPSQVNARPSMVILAIRGGCKNRVGNL
jgi:hypothetical protein